MRCLPLGMLVTLMAASCSHTAAGHHASTADQAHQAPKGPPVKLDAALIEKLTGAKAGPGLGMVTPPTDWVRVAIKRSELEPVIAGIKFPPPLGVPMWATFKPVGDQVMVMGDVACVLDQIFPTVKATLDSGLHVSALHNHYIKDDPQLIMLHFDGMGTQEALATAVGKLFEALKAPIVPRNRPVIDIAKAKLDVKAIEETIGHPGVARSGDGIWQASIDRPIMMHGVNVGPENLAAHLIAIAGTPELALAFGDLAATAPELQEVLKILVAADIEVVSLHNHMVTEEPRMFYLHFWGTAPQAHLAKTLRAALDKTATPRAATPAANGK